jgi:hypothetical protein
MRTHDWLDRRSLSMDRIIAGKVAAEPELLQTAICTLERWIAAREPEPPAVLLEWRVRLRDSLPRILDLLRGDSDEARRLRQSSPFCGILTPAERLRIIREYETTRA